MGAGPPFFLAECKAAKLQPNVVACSAAVSACERGLQWQRALQVLASLPDAGISPNTITMNAAVSACERVSQWPPAFQLLRRMWRRGPRPDVVTVSAAISAAAEGSRWKLATGLLRSVQGVGVEVGMITRNALITACANSAKWDRGLRLLGGLSGHGFDDDAVAYGATLVACRRRGCWEQALRLLAVARLDGVELGVMARAATVEALERGAHVALSNPDLQVMATTAAAPAALPRMVHSASGQPCQAAGPLLRIAEDICGDLRKTLLLLRTRVLHGAQRRGVASTNSVTVPVRLRDSHASLSGLAAEVPSHGKAVRGVGLGHLDPMQIGNSVAKP